MPVTSNVDKVRLNLEKRFLKYHAAIVPAIERGMRFYEGYVIKNMMSGRPGLKATSRKRYGSGGGRLRKSGKIRTEKRKDDYSVSLTFETKYAHVHQGKRLAPGRYASTFVIYPKVKKALKFQLEDGSWRTVKKVTIPKRLFVVERLNDVGKKMIVQEISEALFNITK